MPDTQNPTANSSPDTPEKACPDLSLPAFVPKIPDLKPNIAQDMISPEPDTFRRVLGSELESGRTCNLCKRDLHSCGFNAAHYSAIT